MNNKESKDILELISRYNAEVKRLIEGYKEEVECKDQEVKIQPFFGRDVSIKFKKDPYAGHPHTHVEIWVRGVHKGNFHISENEFEFFGSAGAGSARCKL